MSKHTQSMFSEILFDGLFRMDGSVCLTPNQVAMILGVSISTLKKYRDSGVHPLPYMSNGEGIGYRVDDVRKYLKSKSDLKKEQESKAAQEREAASKQQKISRALEKISAMTEVFKRFEGMPNDAVIPVELAALYLGMSVKSLARLRRGGEGPPYIQHRVDRNSRAVNQKVSYELSDLRAYRSARKVQGTLQTIQLRDMG
ncbi:MAG: helix-turn-helix domain-containing protein [Proteobacteria bacterium]|nr:helix-turn-helix domain-containing protein [Pseudomonadota bacterium]